MRRKFIFSLSLALALAAAPASEDARISHALDRLTFGARPGDLEQVRAMGLKNWIDLQLHPDKIAENPVLDQKLQPLNSLRMSAGEMTRSYPPPQLAKKQLKANGGAPPTPEMRQQLRKSRAGLATVERDLVEGKIYRAVYSNRQLAEVMADFWYNHFNVYQKKGLDRYLVTEYEREAIRPHVLGKFKDMLLATAQSPAMLVYLDNFRSVAPGMQMARGNKGKKLGLNENYGRELMELHTLGVDGGYTQEGRHRSSALLHRMDRPPAENGRRFCIQPPHARWRRKGRAGRQDSGRRRHGGWAQSSRHTGAASRNRPIHLDQTGGPFRLGRSARRADRPHGESLHQIRRRHPRSDVGRCSSRPSSGRRRPITPR